MLLSVFRLCSDRPLDDSTVRLVHTACKPLLVADSVSSVRVRLRLKEEEKQVATEIVLWDGFRTSVLGTRGDLASACEVSLCKGLAALVDRKELRELEWGGESGDQEEGGCCLTWRPEREMGE